jgi:hypothetical protein
VLGIHQANLSALADAYCAIEQMIGVVRMHTPEQFCIGVALSQKGRSISGHWLPIRNYNTRGRKLFAGQRISAFFDRVRRLDVRQQIEQAGRYRVWRAPMDLLAQRDIWHF